MQNNKKIKALVLASDKFGCGEFRSVRPHLSLEKNYPDQFSIEIDYEPQLNNDEWLKQYDIIHYHRTIGDYGNVPDLLTRLDKMGIVSIMDIDDYWAPGTHHPAYQLIKNSKLDELILGNLKIARNITTTSDIFASEIKKYNKNVFVLPNAIDPTVKQYTPNPESSNRVRIGFLGGSSHKRDLELLGDMVGRIYRDGLIDKVQFVLCGYDLRGLMTIMGENGQQTQRPLKPTESVWYEYEKIFTSNYSIVSKEYKEFLFKFKKEEWENVANEPYRRVWTKPVSTYASNYNLFDVSLAPLEDNVFNKMKSPLKISEAGFHKKAIIAQDFGPYQADIRNAIKFGGEWDENGNGILIKPSKNEDKDWYRAVKKLILQPELIRQLGNNLFETVKDKYSMNKVTEDRKNLYLQLINNKNK